MGDARFAELLKPIKDLTQNWQVQIKHFDNILIPKANMNQLKVPLADILSNYMEDLQHIEVTFDGGQTSVNFAQVTNHTAVDLSEQHIRNKSLFAYC